MLLATNKCDGCTDDGDRLQQSPIASQRAENRTTEHGHGSPRSGRSYDMNMSMYTRALHGPEI